jgi:hypothetical protein
MPRAAVGRPVGAGTADGPGDNDSSLNPIPTHHKKPPCPRTPHDAATPNAPTGLTKAAQGNALGRRPTPSRALKGRPTPHTNTRPRHPNTHDPEPPFQGFPSFQPTNPGRCPGLPWVAPLGLREQMTQIFCQDRPRMDSDVDTISSQSGHTCRSAAPSPDESAVFGSLISPS